MELHRQSWAPAGIPALAVYADDPLRAAASGCVLVLHGLHSSKERNLKELESLAAEGFLAVAIDAPGHGARFDPTLESRLAADFDPAFRAIVASHVQEIPGVLDEITRASGCTRFGLTGISMGGYAAFLIAGCDRRLTAVAPILGSPLFALDDPDSPHRNPERFFPVALLAQNAGLDESVPAGPTRAFMRELATRYEDAPSRIAYHEYPRSGHFMEPEDWDLLWARTVDWFRRHI